jgi:hypothetical protein
MRDKTACLNAILESASELVPQSSFALTPPLSELIPLILLFFP